MPTKPISIAIDAMGGDHAPHEIVKGAVEGARLYKVRVQLVGLQDVVRNELAKHDTSGLDIQIVPATEVIDMNDSPSTALRRKKDASVVVTAKCVGKGESQAMIAAGSTGAAMASALFNIGRMEGIDRPGIGVVLPSLGDPCLLLDAGANADCIPEMLLQFARMGSVFMQNVYHRENPKVGLLNIGEELGKGNTLINAAYKLLESDHKLNFIGNIEGHDIFKGTADVAIADGFSGNIALKSAEGVAKMLLTFIKNELSSGLTEKAGALLVKPALIRAKKKVDPEDFGGALLMGVKGICVICHGGSHALAIVNAIRVAKEAVDSDVLGKMGGRVLAGSNL